MLMKKFIEEVNPNRPLFKMAIGLPGSGKDTYYNSFLKDYYVLVSSDAIRQEVFGDVNDQTHNGEVFDIMLKRTIEALNEGKKVYYNATNLSSRRRASLLKALKQAVKVDFATEAFVVATPYEICVERNSNRERTVPQYVMERMLRNFEPPYYNEGWDYIMVVGNTRTPGWLRVILDSLIGVPHDNPHHTLTIGAHMKLTNLLFRSKYINTLMTLMNEPFNGDVRKVISLGDYTILDNATLYHDLGKNICKTFSDKKGNHSEIAHFYNHANVSAYYFISNTAADEVDLLTANLIADHMKFFDGEAAVKKLKEKYGDKYWLLEELHEFDTSAH